MASIAKFFGWIFGLRHRRTEPSIHVLQFRRGKCIRSGRGLSFWFTPLWTSVFEIPCDDREQTFLFHARSRDYQDITAQGVVTYRVVDPVRLAKRIDFSIDLASGRYQKLPLEQLSELLVNAAQQHAWQYLAENDVRELLAEGVGQVRDRIEAGLNADQNVTAMGLEIVSVRVVGVGPTAELERALQAPAYEAFEQEADEAVFQRRALAVEKERAIQENELQNKIELARREEQLITQRGQNERQRAQEESNALKIESEGLAERTRLEAQTEADGIDAIESARVRAESDRLAAYRDLPQHVLIGMAAQEFAAKLQRIDHINVGPDMLGPVLADLVRAGTRKLESASEA